MSEDPDLDATLEDIHARTAQIQAQVAQIRGTGTTANGTITAIVDSAGRVQDLKLPSDVARVGTELSRLIIQAITAAQQNAQEQIARAMLPLTGDERVQAGLNAIREDLDKLTRARAPRPRSQEEVREVEDARFQRMNRQGWNYSL